MIFGTHSVRLNVFGTHDVSFLNQNLFWHI